MTFFRLLLAAALLSAGSTVAMAADQVADDEEIIEELPNRNLERRGTPPSAARRTFAPDRYRWGDQGLASRPDRHRQRDLDRGRAVRQPVQ